MFRKIITGLSLTCLLSGGCKRVDAPVPPQPPPIPQPQPQPNPQPQPQDIDPNSPEKIIGFNITFDQMEKDIIGKWVTLDNSHRWVFRPGDLISLTKAGTGNPTILSRTEVVIDAHVTSISLQSPGTQLSGLVKLRYEQVDGKWFMTEVMRVSVDNYNLKNK